MSRFVFNVAGSALGGLAVLIAAIIVAYKAVDRALGAMKW